MKTNININTFDIYLEPPIGFNSFTHSFTLHRSKKAKRKQKIKRIFDEG